MAVAVMLVKRVVAMIVIGIMLVVVGLAVVLGSVTYSSGVILLIAVAIFVVLSPC
jgi:hypothetical protein